MSSNQWTKVKRQKVIRIIKRLEHKEFKLFDGIFYQMKK